MYDALGPARRSEVTRAPSMMMSVRPRARPRTAGTAAWPSDTWFTPATFSMACARFVGWRTSTSRLLSVVVPRRRGLDAGAEPVTVTASLRATTVMACGPSPSDSTTTGFM
jgi:hypothetical protein